MNTPLTDGVLLLPDCGDRLYEQALLNMTDHARAMEMDRAVLLEACKAIKAALTQPGMFTADVRYAVKCAVRAIQAINGTGHAASTEVSDQKGD